MKLVTTEAVMTALCQHCDSHIEMCEECGMREIVESVPSAWISCNDRLPHDDQMVLVPIITKEIPFTEILICRYIKCERPMFRHYGFRGIKDFTAVTHWMPLPDAPEVEE
jgi:hypothetical protein